MITWLINESEKKQKVDLTFYSAFEVLGITLSTSSPFAHKVIFRMHKQRYWITNFFGNDFILKQLPELSHYIRELFVYVNVRAISIEKPLVISSP